MMIQKIGKKRRNNKRERERETFSLVFFCWKLFKTSDNRTTTVSIESSNIFDSRKLREREKKRSSQNIFMITSALLIQT